MEHPTQQSDPPYIVGIGAASGGLMALEELFDNMSPDNGMAFVIIQQYSNHSSDQMKALLSHHTDMPIHFITDGSRLASNTIYLIPPQSQVTVEDGRFSVCEESVVEQAHMPIDTFFASLAKDAAAKAVGVILSGAGTDGSHGIRAIHDRGGLVIVQNPLSAHFDSMPLNAIRTGVSDLILFPHQISAALVKRTS